MDTAGQTQRLVRTAQQSQLVVDARITSDAGFFVSSLGTEIDLRDARIEARLGQVQRLVVPMTFAVTGVFDLAATLEINLYDQAFEEYSVFGNRKSTEDRAKDKAAKQGEF